MRPGGQDPLGEIQKRPFQRSFNASLRVNFQGSRVTSDGGLILARELDKRLGFCELAAECLTDTRARNAHLPIVDLLRQSVCSRLAGYKDMNDGERVAQDPSFPLIGSEKIWDHGAALPFRLQSLEAQMLDENGNFSGTGEQGGTARFGLPHGPGHGFNRDSGVRRAGAERLQRAF